MFNQEIVRIFEQNCLGCHRPGGIAPMSLATYEAARPWAKAIKEEVLEKRMPPWPAVKGYGEFRNAPPLSPRDIDLIVDWVEGGAPKGDLKDLPVHPLFSGGWPLGEPDLILRPEVEYPVAADADAYPCFVLPTHLKTDRWITAVDLQPGNGSVVRGATFYIDRGRSTPPTPIRAATVKERGNRTKSKPLTANLGRTELGTWIPGQKPLAWPDGVAQRLPAGARVAARIHYHGSGQAARDRSAVGLYFAKTAVRHPLRAVSITDPNALIPDDVDRGPAKVHSTVPEDAQALAIRPCAHPLLISLEATAYRPDGTVEVLVWTRGPRWDWQPTYYFKRPIALPKGTRVEITAYFDHSERRPSPANTSPKPVRWSDLSADPFCVLLLTYARRR